MPLHYTDLSPYEGKVFYAAFHANRVKNGVVQTKNFCYAFPSLEECVDNACRRRIWGYYHFFSSVIYGWQLGDPKRGYQYDEDVNGLHGYFVRRSVIWTPIEESQEEFEKCLLTGFENQLMKDKPWS